MNIVGLVSFVIVSTHPSQSNWSHEKKLIAGAYSAIYGSPGLGCYLIRPGRSSEGKISPYRGTATPKETSSLELFNEAIRLFPNRSYGEALRVTGNSKPIGITADGGLAIVTKDCLRELGVSSSATKAATFGPEIRNLSVCGRYSCLIDNKSATIYLNGQFLYNFKIETAKLVSHCLSPLDGSFYYILQSKSRPDAGYFEIDSINKLGARHQTRVKAVGSVVDPSYVSMVLLDRQHICASMEYRNSKVYTDVSKENWIYHNLLHLIVINLKNGNCTSVANLGNYGPQGGVDSFGLNVPIFAAFSNKEILFLRSDGVYSVSLKPHLE